MAGIAFREDATAMSSAIKYAVAVNKRSGQRHLLLAVEPTSMQQLTSAAEADFFIVSGGVCLFDAPAGLKLRVTSDDGGLTPADDDAVLLDAFFSATRQRHCSGSRGAQRRAPEQSEDLELERIEDKFHRTSTAAVVETMAENVVYGDAGDREPETQAIRSEALNGILNYVLQNGPRPMAVAKLLFVIIQMVRPEVLGLLTCKEYGQLFGESKAAASWRAKKFGSGFVESRGARTGKAGFQKSAAASRSYAAAQKGNLNRAPKTKNKKAA